MMGGIELYERVQLTAALASETRAAAIGLLAALAVLALCFTSLRAMLMGGASGYVDWFVRLVVVLVVLAGYDMVVATVLQASDQLTAYLADVAGWNVYWQRVVTELGPLMESSDTSAWDRLVGWLRGGVLTIVVSLSYFVEVMVFELVNVFAGVFASLLYVLGPFMVVGGVLGDGKSVKQWFGSLLQVALWPVVPPFLMLMMLGSGHNAIETGNTSFILAQNVALAILAALSPAIVALVVGQGGLGMVAAGTVALAARSASFGAGLVGDACRGAMSGKAAAIASCGDGDGDDSADAGGSGRRPNGLGRVDDKTIDDGPSRRNDATTAADKPTPSTIPIRAHPSEG